MKATIHGVAVEGTPQEIMEYQRIQAEKANADRFKQMGSGYDPRQWQPQTHNAWWLDIPDTVIPRVWGSTLHTTIDEHGTIRAHGPSVMCQL